ncbi:hypothetical protein DPMN_187172 [Dreissena polymorpha]|uniref:Uncharacterized protein n=1 Tax=Dreissena polymorpha TaxID=45954 RepID=A0A9D4DPM7_DREPO|nr:hypothetical protein DPMN_187172 [Dreissena polymorpha]
MHENDVPYKSSDPFHEDRKINVAFRVLTRKNAPPSCSHVFKPTSIIFELVQNIIGMKLLTKFHKDRTVNVASRVPSNIIIFELIQDIIETNLLTKFHEDWTINVASREKCPTPGGHALKATETIFKLIQDIIGTNLMTRFPDNRKINVTSRVLTMKNAPPPWWPYRTINVASRVLTRFYYYTLIAIYSHIKNQSAEGIEDRPSKNAPPLGSHVFQANVTNFVLIKDIKKKNLLTIFHEDWK